MLNIIMSCYNPAGSPRGEYAKMCVEGLRTFLISDEWRLILADDGSEDTSFIQDILGEFPANRAISTRVERKGIGGSLNLAMQEVGPDDYWLYTTDDWLLTDYIPLDPALKLLATQDYDYVRLLPIHPNLVCTTKFNGDIGWWLDIHQGCGGFAFGTRPFVATRLFYDKIGPFLENKDAYVTEQDYAERVGMNRSVNLACLVGLHGPWSHIGEYPVGKIDPNV